jgi:parallel beta-helix repeat protein
MRGKSIVFSLVGLVLFLISPSVFANEIVVPGRVEGVGTYFEVKDSEYLNVTLKSSEEIRIVLESIPRMISLNIESSSTDSSTQLTILGLEPNKNYYKYQDSYKNEAVFVSDANGTFSWQQDLTQPHHIWLQEEKGTIYIPDDCSKYGSWDGNSLTCRLSQNVTTSVEITTNNIILDCDGWKITGPGADYWSGYGIHLNNRENVSIKNCNVSNFTTGILLEYGANNSLINNTFNSNYHYGIVVFYSLNSNLGNNIVSKNISYGIFFYGSSNNTLRENAISENWINFSISAYQLSEFINDIDSSNKINGKPIYYLVNQSDNQISGEAGFVGIINSTNITVKDLTLTNNYDGILLAYSTNSKIENVSITNNFWGIHLIGSSENIIRGNNISNNLDGILLQGSGNNVLINNNISNNNPGYNGIHLEHAGSNKIFNNNISNNGKGIYLWDCYSNLVYHNNFINNVYKSEAVWGGNNLFDDGYPSGGNYWSDYTGIDKFSGPKQDQPGSDGIGDTYYVIDEYNKDRYPFMRETGWEAPPSKWSFAIITDLHIGRGYPDYDGASYEDNEEGEDYYLTERLKKVVNWINDNKNNIDCGETECPIKFIAVLGDIADTAEKSEFLKAKKILDRLNDPNSDGDTSDGIPYVPLFGNHDIWPYTDFEEASYSQGEEFFDEIFWEEDATNTKLLKTRLNIQRDEKNPKYKNFAFSYKEMNFIGLDFVERDTSRIGKGTEPEAEIFKETGEWLNNYLNIHSEEPIILFSHHPFASHLYPSLEWAYAFEPWEIIKIKNTIKDYQVLIDFAGHVHSFEEWYGKWPENANIEYSPIDGTSVVTTEALMVGSNGRGIDVEDKEKGGVRDGKKGIIRIVKVLSPTEIDYRNWEVTLTGDEFPALNPNFEWYISKITSAGEPLEYTFEAKPFTDREISLYNWNFGPLGSKSGKETSISLNEIVEAMNLGLLERVEFSKIKLPVKLSLEDKKTKETEYIPRDEIINLGRAFYLFLGSTNQAISLKTGLDLSLFPENREKLTVQINETHSEANPVALIEVNFSQATSNIDLTNLVAQTDLQKRKSVLYMSEWPSVIEEKKTLFIPNGENAQGSVYICPEATSLEEVNPRCPGKITLKLGETIDGLTLIPATYEGKEYYLVFGFANGGGGLNLPPLANANGPYTGIECSPITFDALGSSDPNADPLQYRWDFNNDGVWDTEWLNEATISWTFGDVLKGQIKLEVNDGEFINSDVAEIEILPETIPPEIEISSPEEKTYFNTEGSLSIKYKVKDNCDPNPEVKVYLDGEEYSENEISLGKYLGETEHALKIVAVDRRESSTQEKVSFKVIPKPMKSFLIKKMIILWGMDCPRVFGKLEDINNFQELERELKFFERKIPKICFKNKNNFTILGSFELPDKYQRESLDKSTLLHLKIADKLGKDKVTFKELRNLWFYQEKGDQNDSLGEGIDIKTAVIHWFPEEYCSKINRDCSKKLKHKNWFYIRGELNLEDIDVNTSPPEATILFEIPLKPFKEAGSLGGKKLIKFRKLPHTWFYHSQIKWRYWQENWWKQYDFSTLP